MYSTGCPKKRTFRMLLELSRAASGKVTLSRNLAKVTLPGAALLSSNSILKVRFFGTPCICRNLTTKLPFFSFSPDCMPSHRMQTTCHIQCWTKKQNLDIIECVLVLCYSFRKKPKKVDIEGDLHVAIFVGRTTLAVPNLWLWNINHDLTCKVCRESQPHFIYIGGISCITCITHHLYVYCCLNYLYF